MYPIHIQNMTTQEKLRLMTRTVIDVFNEHNIMYWLACGTLLGAIRDKDIIAWDDDADFMIPVEESPKVLKTLHQIVGKNNGIASVVVWWDGAFKIQHSNTSTPWIDIYPLKRYGNNIGHVQSSWGIKPFPYRHVQELIQIDFLGTTATVPKNYHEHLTHLYGDYMTPVKRKNYWGS